MEAIEPIRGNWRLVVVALAFASLAGFGCGSSKSESPAGDMKPATAQGDATADGDGQDAGSKPVDWASLGGNNQEAPAKAKEVSFSVDPESDACNLDLPFHPPGCGCRIGETATCWTGPPGLRGLPGCADGEQTCEGVEFGSWGACEGIQLDCMVPEEEEQEVEPPPTQQCGCVPGTIITCSEDCSEFIICSLTGTKVCQPDGTWSACREGDLDALGQAKLCRSMFYGCLPDNSPGVFIGDCGSSFTCGQIPPALNLNPPAMVPPPDVPGSPN